MNNQPGFWSAGQNVTLRGVENKVWWAYPVRVVQDTPDLTALYMPAGVLGRNTDHRPTPQELLAAPEKIDIVDHRWSRTDVLFLIKPEDSFSVYLMWETGTRNLDCWYINLQEPLRRTRIGFDTMDLMLDLVVSPSMSAWRWKDADEFAEAERIGLYSSVQARAIRAEGERAIRLLTTQRRSLYEHWANWHADPEWEIPRLSSLWDRVDLGDFPVPGQ